MAHITGGLGLSWSFGSALAFFHSFPPPRSAYPRSPLGVPSQAEPGPCNYVRPRVDSFSPSLRSLSEYLFMMAVPLCYHLAVAF